MKTESKWIKLLKMLPLSICAAIMTFAVIAALAKLVGWEIEVNSWVVIVTSVTFTMMIKMASDIFEWKWL
jgi:hypothetical protein